MRRILRIVVDTSKQDHKSMTICYLMSEEEKKGDKKGE